MLGKQASELQTNVTVSDDNIISGTLNYVTGYTGFHGSDPEQQEGNYLALKIAVDRDCDKVEFELSDAASGKGKVELDEDMMAVVRVTNPEQTLTLTMTKGSETKSEVFYLNGLTLKPKSE